MCACEHGHLNIAKRLLLERDCDASIEDNVSYFSTEFIVSFNKVFRIRSSLLIVSLVGSNMKTTLITAHGLSFSHFTMRLSTRDIFSPIPRKGTCSFGNKVEVSFMSWATTRNPLCSNVFLSRLRAASLLLENPRGNTGRARVEVSRRAALPLARDLYSATVSPQIFEQKRDCSQSNSLVITGSL